MENTQQLYSVAGNGMLRAYPESANEHFFADSVDELLEAKQLKALIEQHETQQVPRLKLLENYYKNQNVTVLQGSRRAASDYDKADHRATHNFAKYISRFITGFMVGIPINVESFEKDENIATVLKDFAEENDMDSLNSQLELDLSIYGRAYEISYNEAGQQKVAKLSVMNSFVVYNYDIKPKAVAGIRYFYQDKQKKDGTSVRQLKAFIYTEDRIIERVIEVDRFTYEDETPHTMKDVPLIEIQNDSFRQGDFENVITLIDLYDAAQSDTANYMSDTNDAVMVIIGGVDLDAEQAKKWRDANMVHIVPTVEDGKESRADVKYIYKQYDVAGMEAYKKRLEKDIHKFTNTPDLNDENFGGTQSGEAMKYKLFGLGQVRADKERLFKKALRRRYGMMFTNHSIMTSGKKYDVNELKFTFTPNLPNNKEKWLELFFSSGGKMSNHSKLSLIPDMNADDEMAKIKEEEKDMARNSEEARSIVTYNEAEFPE